MAQEDAEVVAHGPELSGLDNDAMVRVRSVLERLFAQEHAEEAVEFAALRREVPDIPEHELESILHALEDDNFLIYRDGECHSIY